MKNKLKMSMMGAAIVLCMGVVAIPQQAFAESGVIERIQAKADKAHQNAIAARKEGDFERAEHYEKRAKRDEHLLKNLRKVHAASQRIEKRMQERDNSDSYEEDNYTEQKKVYRYQYRPPAQQRHRETQWFRGQ